MSKKNSTGDIAKLARQLRIRNRLLEAKTMQHEIKLAVERIQRLSNPGTIERFFTVCEIAEETGIPVGSIARVLGRLPKAKRRGEPKP